MPLKQRVPKLKGFNNPFRVEYQARQPRRARGAAASTRSPRRRCTAAASIHKGALVKVLGRGEITRAGHRQGPRLLEVRRGSHHRRRRYRGGPAPAVRATAVRRPRATSSPTADRHPVRPVADQELRSARQPEEHLQGPGPAEQDPVHAADDRPLPARRAHPGARASTSSAVKQLQDAGRDAGRRARLPQPVLRRRAHPVRRLRARDHAVHHGVDHHADPRRGDPQARAVAGAGRGRPAQDHPVDPLPDHRHRHCCRRPA